MDPNACLADIRKLVARIMVDFYSENSKESLDAVELASQIEALDNWMSGSGFLPDRWSR